MDEFTPEQRAVIGKVVEDEVARRLAELAAASEPAWKAWVVGALRSWTMWLGGLLVVLPELMNALAPIVTAEWGAEVWQRVMQLVGVAVILLRAKTVESIPDKGAAS